MNPSTLEQLQLMRLVGMLEAAQEQLSSPTYADLSFADRFALVVEREHHRRAQQRLHRRLKQARLQTTASLADIDFSVPRGLAKTKFLELANRHWVTQSLHLIVVGPTGVGKTFLSSVLADQFCQQGHAVRYFRTADLLLDLKLAKADGSLTQFRRQLAACRLLIFDDWLRDAVSTEQARDLLDLLDER
jgi:DNA replication protein DnaC